MFKLGIISDLDQACTLTREWGMEHIEPRTIWDQNILALSPEEFDRVGKIVNRHGLKVTAIASPIFKLPRDGAAREVAGDFQFRGYESFEGQLELIRRAAEIAKSLGTDRIQIFTFWREPWSDALVEEVAGRLIQAAALARELGVVLSTYLGNGSHAEILRHTGIEPDVFSPKSSTILRWGEGRHEVVTTVVAGQVRHPLSAQDALRS